MRGEAEPGPARVTLPVVGDFTAENDRPTFHPACVEFGDGGLCLRPLPWFGSADLRGIGGADALLELAPGAVSLRAGDTVNAVLLNA
jgi:molybdopterin molybdotransferase